MIRFRCAKCGKKLKAEEEIIGRKVRCSRCENIETVPPTDNLTKPFAKPENETQNEDDSQSTGDLTDSVGGDQNEHLEVVSPNRPKKRKTFAQADEEAPVELFGHSAARSNAPPSDVPRFNVVEKKKRRFDFGKWIVPLLAVVAGLGIIAAISYFVISAQYAEPSFAAEFEALEEVKYYQRWHIELKKSQVKMSIMSKAFQASMPEASFAGTFDELEKSANKYINNSESLVKEAATLFGKGLKVHTKSLLVTTAREMKELRDKIDHEVGEFSQKIK